MGSADNAIAIEAWNTVLFEKFVRYRFALTTGLSGHSDEVFRRRSFPPGARVLDIGCGFGDTTQRIAAQVGPSGQASGMDCAPRFVALAQSEASAAGFSNTRFFAADAQGDDLRGPYDHLFARFGTMFFNLPGAALRNMRQSLKPGGTQVFFQHILKINLVTTEPIGSFQGNVSFAQQKSSI